MWSIAAVCLGSLIAALQTVTLFVLQDLRNRVMRLETNAMDEADRARRRSRFASVAGD
jgi:hypothetical protein